MSATKSNWPSVDELIYKPVSLKRSLFVEFKVKPVPSVCVKVVSESAPKLSTAESLNNLRSSPITASFATDKPPSVCNEPSVVEVASVVSSVFTIPLAVIVVAVNACAAIVLPDCAVKVFAVNWKSSAPAILISIWSSVSAVMLVSASASKINSLPSKSCAPVEEIPVSTKFGLVESSADA